MATFLPDEILAVHEALQQAEIPHAFGGAIALAYYGIPRDTHDVDVNIALNADQCARVLDALSTIFTIADREKAERDIIHTAQTRLRWDMVPIDLFFTDTPFHDSLATRTREVDYVGTTIPIISAEDLIVCKALFNRSKDWPDIESIVKEQDSLDTDYLHYWLNEFTEPGDERISKLDRLLAIYHPEAAGGRP
jgi:predicted nucleotidyltransferase